MRSRIEPIKTVAKMLRRHNDGLINYTSHRVTNAAAEGFNSIIQTLKANARGFAHSTTIASASCSSAASST